MTHESKWKLPSRLFTLLVLCFGVVVCADGDLIRHASAEGEIIEYIDCSNTFDNSLSDCQAAYANCLGTCAPGTCGQCGAVFGGCFGDKVHDYSNCLQEIDFGLDTCDAARDAYDVCLASYNHCLDISQTAAQDMECGGTFFDCKDRTGIDQCQ